MKIGILTFHHTTNFGATLQAYALYSVIKRQQHDVEIIDYRPHVAVEYYQKDIQNILEHKRQLMRPRATLHLLKLLIRRWKMRFFLNTNMRLSQDKIYYRDNLKRLDANYDAIISGSDQIWCIDSYRGFDPSFFLDFLDSQSCQKISYAASFGATSDLGKHKNKICELINGYNALSVRDLHSLGLISKECKKTAVRVLDPTFLIDFKEIRAHLDINANFILVYHDGRMEPHQEFLIKSVAKIKKVPIVSIGKGFKVADKNIISLGPEEWIEYFRKAEYVFTNTYHGTIFSIKFRKLFTVFSRESKANKVNDLLNNFGLRNRIIDKADRNYSIENIFNIDYDLFDQKLEKQILQSMDYLLVAINEKNVSVEAKDYSVRFGHVA